MKAHFSTLLLPSKPPDRTLSPPFFSSSSEEPEFEVVAETEEDEEGENALIYELRDNPKETVQDRGIETESKSPARPRSKRKRILDLNKPILRKPISDDFTAKQEPASSVSDTSPEENVAICLILLSRDKWVKKEEQKEEPSMEIKSKKGEGKNRCKNCTKAFRSSMALRSHKKICLRNGTELKNGRIFECPFCCKVFGSGQALGGHKRTHLMASANSSVNVAYSGKIGLSFMDLNLPAPVEEGDYSVVSDA